MHQNLAMDVPLQDFTGDREQRGMSVYLVLCIRFVLIFEIGTTENVFLALGSLPVVTERFNSLVSTGTTLTVGGFQH